MSDKNIIERECVRCGSRNKTWSLCDILRCSDCRYPTFDHEDRGILNCPVWQPGPPKEAGWFWIEWRNEYFHVKDDLVRVKTPYTTELYFDGLQPSCIIRHAGPVAVPEPVEPESNPQPEPVENKPEPPPIWIDYTNHRGERRIRQIVPLGAYFGTSPWHPNPQWLVEARDVEKNEIRIFAKMDAHRWNFRPEPSELGSNQQPEPAGPCDVDGGFYTGVK